MSSSIIAIFITTMIFSPICYFADVCSTVNYHPFYYWVLILMISSSTGIVAPKIAKALLDIK